MTHSPDLDEEKLAGISFIQSYNPQDPSLARFSFNEANDQQPKSFSSSPPQDQGSRRPVVAVTWLQQRGKTSKLWNVENNMI